MAITLNNSQIKLRIETPGEKYRGSRFDWNGTITQIWYKGKKMLAGEKMLFHRNDRIYGRGLHNEFGIKNCIGYDDIPVGEYFPKIGTGWLKKDEKPYFFFTQYKLDVLDFSWQKVSDTKAVFMCDSGIRNGYGYRYTKTIEIIDNTFTVSYNLENVGEKKISTTEYIHNFLLPSGKNIGPHLELFFNWEYDKASLTENVKTENLIEFTSKGIKFEKTPDVEYFLGSVFEARKDKKFSENGSWCVSDSQNGVVMSESVDFVPYHTDVWGHKQSLSPELFKWLDVEPGSCANWNRTYKFEN